MPITLPLKTHRIDHARRPSFVILAVLMIAGATLYFDLRRSASLAVGVGDQLGLIASP